jgi:drug/metabolite transporter (DMT)-like permease
MYRIRDLERRRTHPMSAVLLALLASLAWGTSDFLAGVESRRTTFWAAVLVSQPAALVGAAIVLAVHGQGPPALSSLWPPLLGGILSALAAFAQYRALTLVPMSLVSPLFAAAAIVPVAWGVARGERPSVVQAAGVALTLVGIVLISRQGPERPSEVTGSPAADPTATRGTAGQAPATRGAMVCTVPAGMSPARARRVGILLALGAGIGFGLL